MKSKIDLMVEEIMRKAKQFPNKDVDRIIDEVTESATDYEYEAVFNRIKNSTYIDSLSGFRFFFG